MNIQEINITPEKQLEFLATSFEEIKTLSQDFESISVTHCNNLSTLVPKALFDENNLKEYLQYNVMVLENDYIEKESVISTEMINIYIPMVNINNYLFDRFGSFEYKHSSTVLLEILIGKFKNSSTSRFFVNVEDSFFQIVVLKNKQLEFYNSFNYKTKEDFIYYILFTSEQLKLNPEEFQLTFLGEIENDSELYKIAYDYIRNIDFFASQHKISSKFGISDHSCITLLNQH